MVLLLTVAGLAAAFDWTGISTTVVLSFVLLFLVVRTYAPQLVGGEQLLQIGDRPWHKAPRGGRRASPGPGRVQSRPGHPVRRPDGELPPPPAPASGAGPGAPAGHCPAHGSLNGSAPGSSAHAEAPVAAPARRTFDADDVRAAAEEFLELFAAENPRADRIGPRIAAAMREIDLTGTYWHTPDELAFGARVAWRNNARCIGRLYWRSLQVRDLRTVGDAASVAGHCFDHLRAAHNGGKIRPMITIFAPESPGKPAPRIWNEQLIRYAGYDQPDGRVLGDPRYRPFTAELVRRGWQPPAVPGAFDILPLVVETVDEGPQMFHLPSHSIHEVPLEHPELPWFADLGLRWHAVPVISNNRLDIGGISYPAAPFNGWYMGTEIGARNLGDEDRYALVPEVAQRLGLDTSNESTLWRDRALVELNRAVLHSFKSNGISITDHHTESRRFLVHLEREERAGRRCPTDWTWIVPPMSGSQTPVFHRHYDATAQVPNFFTDPETTSRGLHGTPPAFRL
ncbi:nitric oxide synthase oxygenase [Kribbella endophytica]